ncbi:Ketohexokinase [Nymphon striatum]|nr:Ketohexokinase [Nymphon striatum]
MEKSIETCEKSILSVGLVCLDIINICEDFPNEDSDQRVLDQRWQRGGNAANTAAVLNMLSQKCEFFGTLSKAPVVRYVEEDFKSLGINMDHCVYLERNDFPTSCVLINAKNGSRTIMHHNKNWHEPTFEDFKRLDLFKYSWIHFEGRNGTELLKMMASVIEWNKNISDSASRIILSLELEKDKAGMDLLHDKVDLLFLGKMYAESRGFLDMRETVHHFINFVKIGASVVCAWGEEGACGQTKTTVGCDTDSEKLHKSSIFPPEGGVVDTLGAGDTFLSGIIYHFRKKQDLAKALEFGCRLAGAKCGVQGWSPLREICQELKKLYEI